MPALVCSASRMTIVDAAAADQHTHRNSWGTSWGDAGYGRIAVGEASLYVADGYQPLFG